MAQNVHRWLLERDHFAWAHAHVPDRKWFQIAKYFPGYVLRRQMVYIDAATGDVVAAQGGETVPEGQVALVARPGWALHDRVLRPAAVFLSSGRAPA